LPQGFCGFFTLQGWAIKISTEGAGKLQGKRRALVEGLAELGDALALGREQVGAPLREFNLAQVLRVRADEVCQKAERCRLLARLGCQASTAPSTRARPYSAT
jgi:hypothetical protein